MGSRGKACCHPGAKSRELSGFSIPLGEKNYISGYIIRPRSIFVQNASLNATIQNDFRNWLFSSKFTRWKLRTHICKDLSPPLTSYITPDWGKACWGLGAESVGVWGRSLWSLWEFSTYLGDMDFLKQKGISKIWMYEQGIDTCMNLSGRVSWVWEGRVTGERALMD